MGGLKFTLGTGSLAWRRQATATLGRALDRGVPGVRVGATRLGCPAGVYTAEKAAGETPVVLFLHGGGYVLGGLPTHAGLAKTIASAIDGTVYLPDYRLAPEFPFPAALDDADEAWRALLKSGIRPDRLFIAGDSAGGGLALALALRLKAESRALPAGLVLLSPWVDLTLARLGTAFATMPEWVLAESFLREAAGWYAQDHDRTDAFVSPLFGVFAGLPPVLLQTGGDEVLAGDTELLEQALRRAGVTVSRRAWPGLWHDFQMQAAYVPEARAALAELGGFVQGLCLAPISGERAA